MARSWLLMAMQERPMAANDPTRVVVMKGGRVRCSYSRCSSEPRWRAARSGEGDRPQVRFASSGM